MTDQDRSASVNLRFVVDRAKLAETDKAIADLRKGLSTVGQGAVSSDKQVKSLVNSVKELGKAQSGLNAEALRRTGGALSQLGLQGPGAAFSRAGDITQITKEFGQLSEMLAGLGGTVAPLTTAVAGLGGSMAVVLVAALPLAVAFGGLALAIKAFNDTVDDGKKRLEAALDTQKTFYDFLVNGTTEAAQKQVDSYKKQLAAQQAAVEETERALQSLENQTGVNRNIGIAAPGVLGDEFRKLTKLMDDNNAAILTSETLIGRFSGALESNAFAANDAVQAEKKLQAQRDKAADAQISSEVKRDELTRTATGKQLADRLDAIKVETAAIDKLKYSTAISDEEAKKLIDRETQLNQERGDITAVQAAVKARETETKAIEDNRKKLEEATKARQKQDDDAVAAVGKRDAALKSADDKYAEDKLTAENRLLDSLKAATEQAVQAAESSLKKLAQARQDLSTRFARDDQKAQRDIADKALEARITEQRAERDSLKDHLREIERIRNGDASAERDALLNRNFLQLFQLQENKKEQVRAEDEKYSQQRADRQQAAQDAVSDQQRQIEIERRERIIAYNQSLQDAQLAYRRELQDAQAAKVQAMSVARQAYARELQDLSTKLSNERNLIRSALTAQLNLIYQAESEKIKAYRATLDYVRSLGYGQTNAQGVNRSTASNGRTITRFASGGNFEAGQPFIFNEAGSSGNEQVNIGGRSFGANGAAYVYPLTGGSVQTTGGGGKSVVLNQTNNIQGSNAEQIAQAVERKTLALLKAVMN